ncbi:M43 family zinc metalloprotease [Pontibacter chitinilyticus]|uniref:M43 family zinc metalloprotease n=1 Tax=Pontibacter chitinilyticus TaxID=2674989 RepID=UPI00321A10CE
MRSFTLTGFLVLFLSISAWAQSTLLPNKGRNCGTESFKTVLQRQYPKFAMMQQQAAQAISQALEARPKGQQLQQAAITIPVVFHVVYHTPSQNISEEQLFSQLAVLNADFNRQNADTAATPAYFRPYAASTKVVFCLASVDPDGSPTNGITRTYTTQSSFSTGYDMMYTDTGGEDIWNRDEYLNIWVCELADNVLGFASSPGTPADVDGVVLHYASVGAAPANKYQWAYNAGRTATHEIGHWLGLKHIWGNGSSCTDSDGINDTPSQLEQNNGCPGEAHISCDNGPYGDMFQNYMDYTDDACMNLFTKGQVAYMRSVISSVRRPLLSSLGCTNTLRADFEAAELRDTLTVEGKTVAFKDASRGVRATSRLWEFEGGTPAVSTELAPSVTYPASGKYSVRLTITNGELSSSEAKVKYIHITVKDLEVYPNPASDIIIIEQAARIAVRQVQVFNQLGKLLLSAATHDRVLRLDVHQLPPGVYFLHITSTYGAVVKKVTVVR